jgi:hypothetical protein
MTNLSEELSNRCPDQAEVNGGKSAMELISQVSVEMREMLELQKAGGPL